jgi:hypothetical protein
LSCKSLRPEIHFRKYSLYNTTTEDWTIILDLAHRWVFSEVKSLAVRELEKLDLLDVDRVSIYHKYEIDKSLLIPRYAALCERESPLTLREGLQLGMETTLMIARAREYARANPIPDGARSPRPAGIHPNEMTHFICEMFDVRLPETAPSHQQEGTTTPPGMVMIAHFIATHILMSNPMLAPAPTATTSDASTKSNTTEEEGKSTTGKDATEKPVSTGNDAEDAGKPIETPVGSTSNGEASGHDSAYLRVSSPTRGRGTGRGRGRK